MWKNRLMGLLGLVIVLLTFLGLSFSVHRAVMIIVGLLIAILGFWSSVGSGSKSSSMPNTNNMNM